MGFFQRISVRLRITIGLIGLMVGSLLMASALGFFPNEQREIFKGRSKLCEALAITGTGMASSGQMATLKASLESVVNRDDDVLSIGLRTVAGELLVVAGPHQETWHAEYGTGVEQNQVPLFRGGELWAHLEVCFASTGGILGLNYWAPAWLLIVLVPALFIQYSIFLRKTLKHLDPSDRVPQHVQDALDTLTVGLVLLNAEHRIIFANRQFSESVGIDGEDLAGVDLSAWDWEVAGSEDVPLPWHRVGASAAAIADQWMRLMTVERKRTFSVNCTKVGSGLMATFDDITLLEEARAAAQQASESKSTFLANMSHEIRTPLNAVLGFTDVLRRGLVTDTEESLDHLNMIHTSGKHLLRLINDILDLSKIEAGKMEVESIDTPLDKVLIDTVDVLGVKAREQQLALNLIFQSAIPKSIKSDPTRLRQIITNLIGNAIKFTEAGSVTVAARMDDGPHPSVYIEITDTGVGMTAEQQERIFDSFSQADETTTRRFGGTGLGLSISRQLCEALGGSLTVRSELGVGSTFTVSLPLESGHAYQLISPEEISAARRKTDEPVSGETIRLPHKSILVVDDGDANRRLITLVLSRAGAQVMTAENGLQAIEIIADQQFDLILLDMQMPVLDGYATAARLRRDGCKTPIVALTGNAMKGDRERCLDAGCDEFLTKPVDLDRLLAVTAGFIGRAPDRPCSASNPVRGRGLVPERPESTTSPPLARAAGEQRRDETANSALSASPSTPLSDGNGRGDPIESTLPMDDEEFRDVVVDFVGRLESRLDGIAAALANADLETVRLEAHWLKGAGGTVGFPDFTAPAEALESAAQHDQAGQALEILQTIQEIRSRIVIPDPHCVAAPGGTGGTRERQSSGG